MWECKYPLNTDLAESFKTDISGLMYAADLSEWKQTYCKTIFYATINMILFDWSNFFHSDFLVFYKRRLWASQGVYVTDSFSTKF